MWKRCLSYKETSHVILLAKLHDMYLYKIATFPHLQGVCLIKVHVMYFDFSGWCGKVTVLYRYMSCNFASKIT